MGQGSFLPELPTISYDDIDDVIAGKLRSIAAEHTAEVQGLTQHRPIWTALAGRADAGAFEERRVLAPIIAAAEARERALARGIAEYQDAIARNRAKVEALAVTIADTDVQFGPVIARLHVTDEELGAAWRRSREISRETSELLASTGDRRAFRRPLADPFLDLRTAAEDLLARLDRIRATHGAQYQAGQKEMTA